MVFFQSGRKDKDSIIVHIIFEFINNLFYVSLAVMLNHDNCLFLWDIDDFYTLRVKCISSNLKKSILKPYLYHHFMPINNLGLLDSHRLYLMLDCAFTVESSAVEMVVILRFVGSKVELKVGHSFDNTFIVLPIPIEFVNVEGWFFTLQSGQKAFIFLCDIFFLFPSEDLIQTMIKFGPDIFGDGFGVCTFFVHDSGYLFQKQPILSFYFYLPNFIDLLPLAVIDDDIVSVFHEFGCDGFHLLHIQVVVCIGDLQLFLFDEFVEVGASAVHAR